jgi:hypothetical protein
MLISTFSIYRFLKNIKLQITTTSAQNLVELWCRVVALEKFVYL